MDTSNDNKPDVTTYHKMERAILDGKLEIVKQLTMCTGLDYFTDWQAGNSLIRMAINCKSNQIAFYLISICSKLDRPPVHLAVDNKSSGFLIDLLSQPGKYDINMVDLRGRTGLHLAVDAGDESFVGLLVELGANVNARDEFGATPLHLASLLPGHSARSMIDLLISLGAQVDARLYSYASSKYYLQHVVRSASADRTSATSDAIQDDGAPLLMASEPALLSEYRSSTTTTTNVINGAETALHLAVRQHNIEAVSLLLASGAQINAEDTEGGSPLANAASLGGRTVALVRCLLAFKPNKRQLANKLAIFHAQNNTETYQELVQYGIGLTSRDLKTRGASFLDSALYYASRQARPEMVCKLLSAGAQPNSSRYGHKMIRHAADCRLEPDGVNLWLGNVRQTFDTWHCNGPGQFANYEQVTKALLLQGAQLYDHPEALIKAVACNSIDLVDCLINHGANINAADARGRNGLFFARTNELLRFLLSRGANVSLKDSRTLDTALHVAIYKGLHIGPLLEHGACPDAANWKGQSPLHIATNKFRLAANWTRSDSERKFALISRDNLLLLLKFAANANLIDKWGRTALHLANLGAARELLNYGAKVWCKDNNGDYPFQREVKFLIMKQANSSYGPDSSYDIERIREHPTIQHTCKLNVAKTVLREVHNIDIAGENYEAKTLDMSSFNVACKNELLGLVERCKFRKEIVKKMLNLKRRDPRYTRNSELCHGFDACDWSDYPIYGSIINSSYEGDKFRMAVLDKAAHHLTLLLSHCNPRRVPADVHLLVARDVVERVLLQLSLSEQLKFVSACKMLSLINNNS